MITAIKYRNPKRPDEAGLVFICEVTQIEQTKGRLTKLGFVVIDDETVVAPAS